MVRFFLGIVIGILLILLIMWWNIGRHRRIPSLTKFMVFSFAVLLIYTAVEMIVSTITGISHDTLSTCVYGCFGGIETLGCTVIKVFKIREENKDE